MKKIFEHYFVKNQSKVCSGPYWVIAILSFFAFLPACLDSSSGNNENIPIDSGACEDECQPGETICVTGGYRPCGDFDDDPCYEWGPVVPCNEGEECVDGACKPIEFVNECVEGSVMCTADGAGIRECQHLPNPGIWVWGDVKLCEVDETCSCGRCRRNCLDECAEGTPRCFGNGYQICGNHDSDDCMKWGPVNPCPDGQTCSNGFCSSQCSNECTVDSVRCTCAGTMVQICGNYDSDPCLEWGPPKPCPLGQTCSHGVCSASCQDECDAPGLTDCTPYGTSYVVCDDHNQNGCLEWGAEIDCPPGETCHDGSCGDYCACDKMEGVCEVATPHSTEPCACDPDCVTKMPCIADGYCDPWCTPGEDPDCGCNCDFTPYCEAQAPDSTENCPCDVDCDLHMNACSDDGYCDPWCPEGVDPDCGVDPCRPRYMLVGMRNADETSLSGGYTNPSPAKGAPWVLLSPGNSSGESEFQVSFAKDLLPCVTEIRVRVWGYDESWFGGGAQMHLYDWNNAKYDVLPDERVGSQEGWYQNSAHNPLPYMYCTTGNYAKCFIQFKLRAGWADKTHFWDAYVHVYLSN